MCRRLFLDASGNKALPLIGVGAGMNLEDLQPSSLRRFSLPLGNSHLNYVCARPNYRPRSSLVRSINYKVSKRYFSPFLDCSGHAIRYQNKANIFAIATICLPLLRSASRGRWMHLKICLRWKGNASQALTRTALFHYTHLSWHG